MAILVLSCISALYLTLDTMRHFSNMMMRKNSMRLSWLIRWRSWDLHHITISRTTIYKQHHNMRTYEEEIRLDWLRENTSAQCNEVTNNKKKSLKYVCRETENYLITPCLKMDFEPLEFWKSKTATYLLRPDWLGRFYVFLQLPQ